MEGRRTFYEGPPPPTPPRFPFLGERFPSLANFDLAVARGCRASMCSATLISSPRTDSCLPTEAHAYPLALPLTPSAAPSCWPRSRLPTEAPPLVYRRAPAPSPSPSAPSRPPPPARAVPPTSSSYTRAGGGGPRAGQMDRARDRGGGGARRVPSEGARRRADVGGRSSRVGRAGAHPSGWTVASTPMAP